MTTVIKAANANGPTFGKQRGLFLEGERPSAGQWIDEARNEAARILQQAHQESEQIRQQAAEAGKQESRAEWDDQLRSRVAEMHQECRHLIDALAENLQQEQRHWFQIWQQDTVALAVGIAGRLVSRAVTLDNTIVVDVVRQSLDLAAGCMQITVQLNPADLERHEETLQEACQQMLSLDRWQLQADQQIAPGSCRVLTEFGEIDQTWETQLRRIAEELA